MNERFFRAVALLLFFAIAACGTPQAELVEPRRTTTEVQPAADALVEFSSEASARRLETSRHKVDFFRLANNFEAQQNGVMCGPTTSVIVLNTLRPNPEDARRPTDPTAYPADALAALPKGFNPIKPRYNQRTFFDDKFSPVKSSARFHGQPDEQGKRDVGLQLRQLHAVLVNHGLDVEIHVVADSVSDEDARRLLIANLATEGDYVIINYDRKTLGQPGGGHISPLAAYDAATDSFLVLDVNPNRAPWVWVPATKLIAAMRTKDTIENRGFLLVREGS